MTDMPTARFALPLLEAGQAQKEMFHNEALLRIDSLLHASVIAIGTEVPPGDPAPGDCWIVGAAPSGAWAGQAHALASWSAGGWRFVAAREGMCVWAAAARERALFRDGAWHVGEVHGRLFVEGRQVVGPQFAAIMEPTGGPTVDEAARAAIVSVLEALRAHGLIEPV
jgi:hypothetical protein